MAKAHSAWRTLTIDTAALALDFVWVITLRDRLAISVALCLSTSFLRLMLTRRAHDLSLFILGGILATGSDAVQVASGVYTYPIVQVWVLPACMFPVWGQIMLLLRSVLAAAASLRPAEPRAPSVPTDIFISAAFGIALVSVCLFYQTPPFVAVVSGVVAVVLLQVRPEPYDLALTAIAAIVGPLAEAILVHNQVYIFAVATWQRMPLWHPFFWAASLLFVRRMLPRFWPA